DLRAVAGARVVAEPGPSLELVARLLGRDQDRAADRVPAVDRALRALQHLDALHVEELLGELGGIRQQHAVDQDRGRRLAVASLRDAADRQERGALILRLDQRDVRRQRDEILRALDAG